MSPVRGERDAGGCGDGGGKEAVGKISTWMLCREDRSGFVYAGTCEVDLLLSRGTHTSAKDCATHAHAHAHAHAQTIDARTRRRRTDTHNDTHTTTRMEP